MADGITISIDSASLALTIFMIYKLVQIEYRVRKLEEAILNEGNSCKGRG